MTVKELAEARAKIIQERQIEIDELVVNNPKSIPVPTLAKFFGANAEGLREMIFKGQCPFGGIAWQKDIHGNRAFKVDTFKFFRWILNLTTMED